MITTTAAWDAAFAQDIVPETFVQLEMDLIAQYSGAATLSGSDQSEYSTTNGQDVLNNTRASFNKTELTLEFNQWVLDGHKSEEQDSIEYYSTGSPDYYVGGFPSDESQITMTFSSVVETKIPGFTIIWDRVLEGYATAFDVIVYNGATELARKTITDNDNYTSFVELEVENFDRVVIQVVGWNMPDRRIRMTGFCLGVKFVFDKNQILSYSYEQTGDPVCSEMTSCTADFTVDNSDGRWDLLNRTGLAKLLGERQKIDIRYGVDLDGTVSWVDAGRLFLAEWNIPSNGLEARFVARDIMSFGTNVEYSQTHQLRLPASTVRDVYSGPELGVNGAKPIDEVGGGTYHLMEYKAYYTTETDDPTAYTHIAGRIPSGWVNTSNAEGSPENSSPYLVLNEVMDLFPDAELQYDSDVRRILLYNSKVPGIIQKTPTNEVFQQCLNAAGLSWYCKADKTMWACVAGTRCEETLLLDWHYSYPEIELTKPLKRIDIIQHYPYNLEAEKIVSTQVGDTGEIITVNNPYFLTNTTASHYQDITDAIIRTWEERTIISGTFRANPKFELFDIVNIETKYGTFPVMITSIKYTYSGSFVGTYVGRKMAIT